MNASSRPTCIVLGANGTLGQALVRWLPEAGYELRSALTRAECDITRSDEVRAALDRHRPDVVFNAAAYTDVDRAEAEVDAAFLANAIAPELLARELEARGGALVHYSTDFVFDGALERDYDELDTPAPLGAYGRSKLGGERLVAAATRRAFILRVGCLYGHGGRNFPSTIVRRLKAGEIVRADRDRRCSPTWVRDVVTVSAALARTEHFGLYHCTAAGETSWADFARFVATELGLGEDRVDAVPYAALRMRAARPIRAILDNRMLRLRGLDTLPPWQDAARAYIRSEGELR